LAPNFGKSLSQALGEPVNKKNFKAAIKRQQGRGEERGERSSAAKVSPFSQKFSPTPPTSPTSPTHPPTLSWAEAPDVSQFYGRENEQRILQRWIGEEQCRLVAILGMGGIGKSTLATKVARDLVGGAGEKGSRGEREQFGNWEEDQVLGTRYQVSGTQNQVTSDPRHPAPITQPPIPHTRYPTPARPSTPPPFTHILWRSLRNAPPLTALLADLIGTISDYQETGGERSRLLHWLRKKRCLIVLDNVETVLQAGEQAGYYREGYQEYGELLRLVGETAHQSCVVLTSREKPAEIAALEGLDGSTRTLQLSGSVATALALISIKGLTGTVEQQRQLCDRYSYNPLALKIVATTIQDLFEGDLGAFLAEDAVIFNSIRRLLEEQFQRLSELEQAIMTWLAINRDWTEISELAEDILPTVPKVRLLEALESLRWRGLIESQQRRYTQQPVVMEFITEQLVETLSQEVVSAELCQWHHYALMKTTVRDFVTESQIRLIVMPVAEAIRDRFPTVAAQTQQLQTLLATIRITHPAGYGAGNLINLSNALNVNLTDFDFSCLTIRQADLRYRLFQRVNFAQAHFSQTVFKQTFGSIFALSYSLDGTFLITGDSMGVLRLWDSVQFQPVKTIQAHSSYVWDIRPNSDGRRVASCSEDQTVKVCDLATGDQQAELSVAPTIGRAIVWLTPDILAIGNIDGTIHLWQPFSAAPIQVINAHTDIVNSLSWHPESGCLASSSSDGTVKLWKIPEGICWHTQTFESVPVRWAAWSPQGHTLACALENGTLALWQPEQNTLRPLQGHTSTVWSVDWRPDGKVVASASNDATIRLWDAEAGRCLRVLQGHQNWVWYARWHPHRGLIASGGHDGTLRLWDTTSGHCLQSCCGHLGNIRAIAPNSHHETVALGCDDTILRLWHPQAPTHFDHALGHHHLIADVRWSPDGKRFVMLTMVANSTAVVKTKP
jgi:WD40 repeat protein